VSLLRARLACAVAAAALFASVAHAQDPPPAASAPQEPRGIYFAQHDAIAFGTNEAGFLNATIGARVDYAATPALRIGIELAYANLEGDAERAHSVLGLLQFEGRAALSGAWSVPARIALGHLASNGAVLRIATGAALKLASRLELMLLIAPTLFSTRDGVYPAVGPGLELSFRL